MYFLFLSPDFPGACAREVPSLVCSGEGTGYDYLLLTSMVRLSSS